MFGETIKRIENGVPELFMLNLGTAAYTQNIVMDIVVNNVKGAKWITLKNSINEKVEK